MEKKKKSRGGSQQLVLMKEMSLCVVLDQRCSLLPQYILSLMSSATWLVRNWQEYDLCQVSFSRTLGSPALLPVAILLVSLWQFPVWCSGKLAYSRSSTVNLAFNIIQILILLHPLVS